MAEVLDVTGDDRAQGVARAAEVLRSGELAVVPTDTAYGLAADAFNLDGTGRVFTAKDRARTLPLSVFVRSPKQLAGLTTVVPEAAERLVAAYWPGPLTIVLMAEPNLRWDLGRTEGTVAVRMPLDDVALDVVTAVGPLAVTVATRSGRAFPDSVAAAQEILGEDVAVYLDDGPRDPSQLSTIVDLTRREPHVLRPGHLDTEEVLAIARGELDPFATDEDERTPVEDRPPDEGDDAEPQG